MRLWSLHPGYLDARGLVALWHGALLARAVLQNLTRGYIHHPQLARFKTQADPAAAMNAYLTPVLEEAIRGGYLFNANHVNPDNLGTLIPVTIGQLLYEVEHLRTKTGTPRP